MTEVANSTKQQLERVACRLFRERGFHGTSVRDIAEAIGIQGGSLYSHVEKKDDLLWEIVNHAADRFFAALTPIVSSGLGVMQKFRKAIIAHVEVLTGDLNAAAVYTVEWRHLSPERQREITKRRDEYEAMFRSLVTAAIRDGFLSPPDSASASLFILSSLNHIFTWYRPGGRLSAEEVGAMMADYIIDGMRRRAG